MYKSIWIIEVVFRQLNKYIHDVKRVAMGFVLSTAHYMFLCLCVYSDLYHYSYCMVK